MTALYQIALEYRAGLDRLADLDLDAQTVADTVEGMQGALQDKLRAVIAYSLELDIDAHGASEASKRMADRAKSLASRVEWLQRYALDTMQATGLGEVCTDEFAAKVAKTPPKVVIADDAAIPIEYIRVKTISEPDKTALKTALQGGASLPGVSLVSGFRLAIK